MTLTADIATPDTEAIEDQSADQTVWISFRCTPAERAEVRDHAHLARISVSKLVRGRVLGEPPPKAAVPAINAQVHAHLGRVGNNLNQLTKLANESGQPQLQPLAQALAILKSLLDQVRLEVIGTNQVDEEDQA